MTAPPERPSKAYRNVDFLNSRDGRTLRILSEYLEPQSRFRRHRVEVSMGACLGHATHGILHRRLKLEAHTGSLRRGRVAGSDELDWVSLEAIDRRPVSGATRKILRMTRG